MVKTSKQKKKQHRNILNWPFKIGKRILSPSKLTSFQAVDVLGVHSKKQAFLVKQSDEVMSLVRPVLAARVELFRQFEKRTGILVEKVNVEHGGRVRDIVPLQVVVQAGPRGPY